MGACGLSSPMVVLGKRGCVRQQRVTRWVAPNVEAGTKRNALGGNAAPLRFAAKTLRCGRGMSEAGDQVANVIRSFSLFVPAPPSPALWVAGRACAVCRCRGLHGAAMNRRVVFFFIRCRGCGGLETPWPAQPAAPRARRGLLVCCSVRARSVATIVDRSGSIFSIREHRV